MKSTCIMGFSFLDCVCVCACVCGAAKGPSCCLHARSRDAKNNTRQSAVDCYHSARNCSCFSENRMTRGPGFSERDLDALSALHTLHHLHIVYKFNPIQRTHSYLSALSVSFFSSSSRSAPFSSQLCLIVKIFKQTCSQLFLTGS